MLEATVVRVEDRLAFEQSGFVDVDERLVDGVVWKQNRVDLDARRPSGTREREREAQALPFGQHLDRSPLQRCRLAVGNDPQSFGNDREQLVGPFARNTRLEQRLRIF